MVSNVAVIVLVVVVGVVVDFEKGHVLVPDVIHKPSLIPVNVLKIDLVPVLILIFLRIHVVLGKDLAVGASKERPPAARVLAELTVGMADLVGQ